MKNYHLIEKYRALENIQKSIRSLEVDKSETKTASLEIRTHTDGASGRVGIVEKIHVNVPKNLLLDDLRLQEQTQIYDIIQYMESEAQRLRKSIDPEYVPSTIPRLREKDVEWVVSSSSELGVKIGDQFFFLYKGESLQYDRDSDRDMMWTHVGKREFGETCQPTTHDGRKIDVDTEDGRDWRHLFPQAK